jgi:endonuclease/exonuclease/phosphatase family metal-dependent hydrolase
MMSVSVRGCRPAGLAGAVAPLSLAAALFGALAGAACGPDLPGAELGTAMDGSDVDGSTGGDEGAAIDASTTDGPAADAAAATGAVVLINEVLANEPGSNVAGEFVEVVNVGGEAADLGGFQLSDSSAVRHVFAGGTALSPGEAIVVFGGAGAIPPGLEGAVAATTGALGLSNGGDSVALVDAAGAAVDGFTYTSALSGTDGVSMNRAADGDPSASFVLHTQLAPALSSPGTRADGSPFEGLPPPPPPPPDPGGRVRVVAANLTSGNNQSYDPGHGIRILQGLDPDVALVSEMNFGSNSAGDIRAFVDQAFGADFQFIRQNGVSIPCGVVSRFPIVESGVLDDPTLTDRDIVFARIDVPGSRDLWAVSVHLSGASSTNRATAATTLVTFVQNRVPAGDLLVIGGDFNTGSRSETAVVRLAAVVDTSAPFPVDQAGNSNTNQPRSRPLDWLMADPDLDGLEVPAEIGANAFPSGLVLDTRVYQPLADVAPAQLGDSAATNMQHMAVVRDFEMPTE